MCTTATAKRRRSQARMVNGRKTNHIVARYALLAAQRKAKGSGYGQYAKRK